MPQAAEISSIPLVNPDRGQAATAAVPPLLVQDEGGLISPNVVAGFVRVTEFLVITTLGMVLAALYVDEETVLTLQYLGAVTLAGIVTVATFGTLGLYKVSDFTSAIRWMPRVALGWTMAIALLFAALFFFKAGPELSRVWLAMWYVAGAMALLAGRLVLARVTRRWTAQGRLYRRAVVYGGNAVTAEMLAQLAADANCDVRIVGIFDDRDEERTGIIAGYPRMGGLDALLAYSRRSRVDLVLVALPVTAEQRLVKVVNKLSVLPVDIKLPARSTQLRFAPRTYSHVGSIAMIDLYDKPITDWGIVTKWAFDKVVAASALLILSPVMAAVALAIRLDSRGPILFRQKRYGFNNELIQVYKFRSMYVDRCDANASRLVTKGDPRVTRVGRFIRKTSLDELPQLFNVLKGELSLVGPRPHAVQAKAGSELYDDVVDGYFARHKVKPGITGWAQINGWRGETDTHEKIQKRVEHDLYYIENWSVFFDIYILLKTPVSLLKTENAY
jgi:Undecaprenyl-phosphate glucose phosphotransferase